MKSAWKQSNEILCFFGIYELIIAIVVVVVWLLLCCCERGVIVYFIDRLMVMSLGNMGQSTVVRTLLLLLLFVLDVSRLVSDQWFQNGNNLDHVELFEILHDFINILVCKWMFFIDELMIFTNDS